MTETVLLARVYHESNTYTDGLTTRDDFRETLELYGDAVPAALAGTNTEVGGILAVAERENVDLECAVVAEAEPHGPVAESAYRYFVDEVVDAVERRVDRIDGVVLPLHGAMVPEHLDDGEGPLVSRVRAVVGATIPIVVTIDPNANVSEEMVEAADAIVAYETTPHVDMAETGHTGMEILLRAIRGEIDPEMHVERPPVIPSAVRSTTLEAPMADVESRARVLEERPGVLKVNVCQGFWSADVPYMGFSVVSVTDGDPEAARETARDVGELVWDRRNEFVEETVTSAEAVRRARELTGADAGEGPVVIAEMHDNPGGGRPADGTKLLGELLEQGVTDAGLAILHDPDAVAACVKAGVGERVTVTLGGNNGDPERYGPPLEAVEGYVATITDGQYENTGPMKTGATNALGRTVRFQCGADDGVALILTERRVQPWDAEIWRHVGVQPERLAVIGLKSAVHYRADYGPLASEIVSVDESPTLAYDRVARPVYPLDQMHDDAYPE